MSHTHGASLKQNAAAPNSKHDLGPTGDASQTCRAMGTLQYRKTAAACGKCRVVTSAFIHSQERDEGC